MGEGLGVRAYNCCQSTRFYPVEMIDREAKLKHGTAKQYSAIDEAIRTAQFIRNKDVR